MINSMQQRVLSIDVLRGLTIALMILVNDPGDWAHTYTQLDHAPWNGFTLTDLVFPNFLFLVGCSIIFSLGSRIARGDSKRSLALHILRRSFYIFAIKMALTAFPYFHYTHFRIYGVLTRIALCYLAAGLICLITIRARNLALITVTLLVGYWALMRFIPVPLINGTGYAIPTHSIPILDPDNNLTAWLDRAVSTFTQRMIHTGTLYEYTRDPEGLLSTLPAIATTLIGCLTALWLRRPPAETSPAPKAHPTPPLPATISFQMQTLSLLVTAALLFQMAGRAWNLSFPINKNLWTSSYVLFSASCSLLLLVVCFWLIDIRRLNQTRIGKALLWPWLVFGANAITAFVLSNLLVKIALWIKVPDSFATPGPTGAAKPITTWLWAYKHLFARHGSNNVTSLAFAIAFVVLCFVPNYLLYRKQIFLKL